MKYLLVGLTSTLSVLKVTCQGRLAKKEGCTVVDSIFLNMLIFAVAALVFSPYLFSASKATWTYSAIYAICNVLFQTIYVCTISRGNVSVAVMFANFGMIVPMVMSCFVFNEVPSVFRLVGIALTVVAFVFTFKKSGEKIRGYQLLVVLAMLTNGCALAVQKLFAVTCADGGILSFVSASYMLSALLSVAIYGTIRKRGQKRSFFVGARDFLTCAGAGMSLALFLAVNTYAGKLVDASFHYPAHAGCTILLSTLSGLVIFHDKISVRQGIACVFGGIAIVMMNF